MKKFQFIIFGGTGDLTRRKLLPAFYDLLHDDLLSVDFSIIAIGRRYDSKEEYLQEIHDDVKKHVRFEFDEEIWDSLAEKIKYQKMDLTKNEEYKKLKQRLDQNNALRIYYLALAPDFFEPVVECLEQNDLVENSAGMSRLVIEKPFGRDFKSARQLNNKIRSVYPEENIYRIDHYLGKEMIQNVLVIRFANILFESIWNHKYIDNIQLISTESVGVGQRGDYYEKAGVLKDMLQNHMLQLLTMTAMEPPARMDSASIRSEKVKILKSLGQINSEEIEDHLVFGQYGPGKWFGEEYKGYRQEDNVASDSMTETFVALKLYIDNLRWSKVPFYIKTGKRLFEKKTEIIVEFKDNIHPDYRNKFEDLNPDLLVIRIQPAEGVFLRFNAKKPGAEQKIVPVNMDFCQNCGMDFNTPGAYERLIKDLFAGDSTLFTRWDEVEYSWKFVDQISEIIQKQDYDFPNYEAGSRGPKAAEHLLAKDGRKWWQVEPNF